MINKLSVIEKKINNVPRLFKGKTINLSNKILRQPRDRTGSKRVRDQNGEIKPRSSYPKNIVEYSKFIHALQRIKLEEELKEHVIYFSFEESPDKPGWYENMFLKTSSMHENYMNYRDVVFINKRLTKTRFNRILFVFFGVNSSGKTVIFSVCFIHKEDDDNFDFALDHFKKAFGDDYAPKLFIIERNNTLKSAIHRAFSTQMRVLYCNEHY